VRAMSDELGVNMMTVSKAYQMLKDQGIAEGDRRKGTKIVDKIVHQPQEEFTEKLQLLLAQSYMQGISIQEIHQQVDQILQGFARKEGSS